MTIVLAGISAINVYLSRTSLIPVHSQNECAFILNESIGSTAAIAQLKTLPFYNSGIIPSAALAGVSHEHLSVELLISCKAHRRKLPHLVNHLWQSPLFPKALYRINTTQTTEPLYVVSPELHFLLRCRETRTPAQALLLALQLCGTYELRPDIPEGFVSRPAPLTCAQSLQNAVQWLPTDARGQKIARYTASLALDGSASPRESGFAAFAITSRRHGGAGLPAPRLNYEKSLSPLAKAHLPQRTSIRYDFYWPEKHLACEYDSSWWHSDPLRAGADDQRRLAARALNDDLIGVARQTLSTLPTATALFDQLAHILQGRAPRPLSARSLACQEELWRLCFGHHSFW